VPKDDSIVAWETTKRNEGHWWERDPMLKQKSDHGGQAIG